ncbi:hypothetical protein [Halorussus sp. AFM4]|uniref:hypothetical protein n=1 Tax=Halorussus sp. AFM4 TaxID=3421651 RepID=UPI003EBC835D
MDRDAILVGAGADAGLAALAAAVELPEGVRWPAFAVVLAGGFVGGYLAGRLAEGPWRRRVNHGLLAGLLGGAALAVAVRWSFEPGAPSGALWPANYVLATGARWLPPGVAARYDALIGTLAALPYGVLYAAEGALAAGAAPGGEPDAPAVRE